MSNVRGIYVNVQHFKTVENVIKNYHKNKILLELPDSKESYRVKLQYHEYDVS